MGKLLNRLYSDENDGLGFLHRMLVEGIEDIHEMINNIKIHKQIMSKTLPATHYVLYLSTIWHMYKGLETVMMDSMKEKDPILSYLYFSEVSMASMIRQDLNVFLGHNPMAVERWLLFAQTHLVLNYINRLHALKQKKQSHKLLAHFYATNMGDLSGMVN
ncbi:hypothetical protein HMI55_002403 [Coelomomyces lativittatus]|nr:hypothetical protein HMI55_002403 [Coelomomyces lativittatus]